VVVAVPGEGEAALDQGAPDARIGVGTLFQGAGDGRQEIGDATRFGACFVKNGESIARRALCLADLERVRLGDREAGEDLGAGGGIGTCEIARDPEEGDDLIAGVASLRLVGGGEGEGEAKLGALETERPVVLDSELGGVVALASGVGADQGLGRAAVEANAA
jgi:hypothetical protein